MESHKTPEPERNFATKYLRMLANITVTENKNQEISPIIFTIIESIISAIQQLISNLESEKSELIQKSNTPALNKRLAIKELIENIAQKEELLQNLEQGKLRFILNATLTKTHRLSDEIIQQIETLDEKTKLLIPLIKGNHIKCIKLPHYIVSYKNPLTNRNQRIVGEPIKILHSSDEDIATIYQKAEEEIRAEWQEKIETLKKEIRILKRKLQLTKKYVPEENLYQTRIDELDTQIEFYYREIQKIYDTSPQLPHNPTHIINMLKT